MKHSLFAIGLLAGAGASLTADVRKGIRKQRYDNEAHSRQQDNPPPFR